VEKIIQAMEINKILPIYEEEKIQRFDDEDSFMDAYIEVLKQSIEMLYLLLDLKYFRDDEQPLSISKDESTI
jgi:hypothetical protein